MAGNLTFDQLKKAVAAGEIDTVLACAVDMQGRLVGKRFLAKYFVESAYDETHGCNYLLANDIDMEPVPGYKAASWSQGLWRLRHEARPFDACAAFRGWKRPRWCSATARPPHP